MKYVIWHERSTLPLPVWSSRTRVSGRPSMLSLLAGGLATSTSTARDSKCASAVWKRSHSSLLEKNFKTVIKSNFLRYLSKLYAPLVSSASVPCPFCLLPKGIITTPEHQKVSKKAPYFSQEQQRSILSQESSTCPPYLYLQKRITSSNLWLPVWKQ